MAHQIHSQFISKEAFLKSSPTLCYGTDGKWLVVMTPDEKVCALALKSFPASSNLFIKYQKHSLVEKKIRLQEKLSCLLVGTPLQQQIWMALLEIPHGSTWSYQELANYVQRPKAVRAVANAVGANPISPLIPCHRVVGSQGYIGGYYWGIDVKVALLREEGADLSSFKGISSF